VAEKVAGEHSQEMIKMLEGKLAAAEAALEQLDEEVSQLHELLEAERGEKVHHTTSTIISTKP